ASERAATGAALLLALGMNAGTWLLWPLELMRAFVGDTRGSAEVHRILSQVHLRSGYIINVLHPPFALMVSFLDKFLLGTALHTAYLFMLLYWWALVEWLESPRPAPLV